MKTEVVGVGGRLELVVVLGETGAGAKVGAGAGTSDDRRRLGLGFAEADHGERGV
jgi:hypothetical protein